MLDIYDALCYIAFELKNDVNKRIAFYKKEAIMAAQNGASTFKKIQDEINARSRGIWLTGLGAFSVAEAEGEKMLKNLLETGKNLVEKGEILEKKGKEFGSEQKDMVTERVNEIFSFVEKKVKEMVDWVGTGSPAEVETLSARIDKLTQMVADLNKKLDAKA